MIIGSDEVKKVGDVARATTNQDGNPVRLPMVVVREATFEEWLAQCEASGVKFNEGTFGPPEYYRDKGYFYEVREVQQ